MQEIETSFREEQPLENRRIVVTRPWEQSTGFSSLLKDFGAHVIQMPTVKICGLNNPQDLDRIVVDSSQFDWIVFTSTNAVRFFIESIDRHALSVIDICRNTKICCVGKETARVSESYGLEVACVPITHTGLGIVELFASVGDLSGESFLIPSGSESRPTVPEGLRNLNASVTVVLAYETIPILKVSEKLLTDVKSGIDLLTFTSPSTVKSFHDLVEGQICAPAAVIGPVTARKAQQLGYEVLVHPVEYSMSGLLETVIRHFSNDELK